MLQNVPHSSTPVVLLIGLFDPTGIQDAPADTITCAYHGVHSVSAVTGIAVADSASTLHIDVCDPELMDEQIRILLEDTQVQSIKVGALLTVEQVSVVAQIAADYANVPLTLHLGPQIPMESLEDPTEEPEHDMVAHATLELLVPQCEIVVLGPNAMDRWFDEDLTERMDVSSGPQSMLHLGASWVMACGYRQRPGHLVYLLSGANGESTTWPWKASPPRTQDSTGLLACALAASLARGDTVEAACAAACEYEQRAVEQAFQAGMGQRTAQRLPKVIL